MICSSCGTENREGRKFCSECGTTLALGCPSCGAANEPGEKFCGECGTALGTTTASAAGAPATSIPAAERRLVSVLFADLVGFTAASEERDAEETRELLSRYFEQARTLAEAEAVLTEAREIFERLEAKPWLERAEKVDEAAPVPA